MQTLRSLVSVARSTVPLIAVTILAGCSTVWERQAPTPKPPPSASTAPTELGRGTASWYGPGFDGRQTASGERFDERGLTAAHRTLPFGTRVLVRNLRNGREVVVRINDRGPWARGRLIDLSKAAAAALDMVEAGEASVVLFSP